MVTTIVIACIGFGLSMYTYIVEEKIKKDVTYKPFCDISARISCSKVVTSDYANLFFISNAISGMGYYAVVALLAALHYNGLLLIATAGGCAVSIFLAYILYAKIRSLCVVCTSLYVVNAALLACAIAGL